MSVSGFYLKIIEAFNTCEVRYLLVGGHAVNYHGYIRSTLDMDLWIDTSEENLEKLFKSLLLLGFQKIKIEEAISYFKSNHIFKLPHENAIIDIMDSFILRGDFEKSYLNKESLIINDTKIDVIGFNDLIENKFQSFREKDLLDVKELKSIQKLREKSDS
jgi:hypothetical protein